MVAVLIPHFDLPFRIVNGSFAVAEQDSAEDVANCVESIIRTPIGFRDDNVEFGIDDQVFNNVPLDRETLTEEIVSQEPRASIIISEDLTFIDNLVSRLTIEVSS